MFKSPGAATAIRIIVQCGILFLSPDTFSSSPFIWPDFYSLNPFPVKLQRAKAHDREEEWRESQVGKNINIKILSKCSKFMAIKGREIFSLVIGCCMSGWGLAVWILLCVPGSHCILYVRMCL